MCVDEIHKDNYIIAKCGMTGDMDDRITSLLAEYGQYDGVVLQLKLCSMVDGMYMAEAEKYIKDMCKSMGIMFPFLNYTELIIFDPKMFEAIKVQYKYIITRYGGATKHLQARVTELEHNNELKDNLLREKDMQAQMREQQMQAQMREQDMQAQMIIKDKDNELKLKDKDLQMKEMENGMLKLKIEMMEKYSRINVTA